MTLLTKFETKSNRVKGVSFHSHRPWLLASLHNGVIQLWDYRIRTLIDRFDEHEGPVRSVSFHQSQPLFVSGGDDYKVKVWNYKLRRCLFTLLGHLDYIRTVQMHHECPWIISSSDDQTIRIWNWQSRNCISVLTGHNHYVMCAQFHPKEDLVVSASLDQTIRVWDISGGMDDLRLPQNDLFGNTDVIVTHVLEGHDRGINWASFHPSLPLIISGADDRQVKLWRMNDTKAWEVDTLRGHFSNVSCCLFHPRQELILSNSEDKTIRVWDMTKRVGLQTFRREHDRFWILSAHPERNLFAAGHDSGLLVFKLERERPAYYVHGTNLYYVKDRYLRIYNFQTGRESTVTLKRSGGGLGKGAKTIHYNPAENAVVISYDNENSYDLYHLPKDGRGEKPTDSRRGVASAACFVARNRMATFHKGTISVKNLKNETTKKITPADISTDNIFPASTGCVLLRTDEKISLFDLQQRKVLAELMAPSIKFVVWSSTNKNAKVALVARDVIIIANRNLEQQCLVGETIRIKSGAWHNEGVFVYTTLNHIKYCLPNGDTGIIRTLDVPLYITAVHGNKVYCLDREGKNRALSIDPTEFIFKLALLRGNTQQILKMVKEANLIGKSIVAYLQKKGFPELALHFVKDPKTRFNLALECGNVSVALEAAKAVDEKECWHRLGKAALHQGNHQVVEMAYLRTRNSERLSFLYLITGNTDKLKRMLKFAENQNDVMARFHNALYLGDVVERTKVLASVGQLGLAYLTAKTHGLEDLAAAIQGRIEETGGSIEKLRTIPNAELFMPPIPILRLPETNWPLLTVSKGAMDSILSSDGTSVTSVLDDDEEVDGAAWGDDIQIPGDGDDEQEQDGWGNDDIAPPDLDGDEGENGWDTDDLDINISVTAVANEGSGFATIRAGPTPGEIWCRNSNFAADHIAAGSLESAMQLLSQQFGIVNFVPLKAAMQKIYCGARVSIPGVSSTPSLTIPLLRNWKDISSLKESLPSLSVSLSQLINKLKAAYSATTNGKFTDALQHFRSIMHSLALVHVSNRQEVREVQELMGICRDYANGIRIELKRKEIISSNPVRGTELAAYFTHCNLQPKHLVLSLRSAMNCSYKIGCLNSAVGFARRLLELNPSNKSLVTQAKKVIAYCERNPGEKHTLKYDERNPFVVCGNSLSPIYKGNPIVNCAFCSSPYLPKFQDSVCQVCEIAGVGKDATGFAAR